MTDDEIDARLPSRLHPYLREKVAHRLLRPVKLGSPEANFAIGLLYVLADRPYGRDRWPQIVSDEANSVDRAFVRRCYRVLRHARANLERRTTLLLARLDQANEVFDKVDVDAE
jgi:hypothetical protein